MGCGCGKPKKREPVAADAPNPNDAPETPAEASDAWWQAHPSGRGSTVAVPMPS